MYIFRENRDTMGIVLHSMRPWIRWSIVSPESVGGLVLFQCVFTKTYLVSSELGLP